MRRWIAMAALVCTVGCSDDEGSPTAPSSSPTDSNTDPVLSREERLRLEAAELADSLGYASPRLQTAIPAPLTLSDGTRIDVEYGDSVFYNLAGVSSYLYRDYMIRPLLNGNFLTENRFLKSGAVTIGLVFISRDPVVVEVSESGGLRFRQAGKTSVIVGAGSAYIDLPIEVIDLADVQRNMNKTQVIETWGLADGTASAILDWLDSTTLNLKDYYNDEPGEDLYIEQWFYAAKIPKGYLEFRGGRSDLLRLYQARTTRWEHILYSPVYPQFYLNY